MSESKKPRLCNTNSRFQNHDNQANISHIEEILREQEIAPLSYTRLIPGVGGVEGPGNYWVPVSLSIITTHFDMEFIVRADRYTATRMVGANNIDTPINSYTSCIADNAPILILWFFDSRGKLSH